MKLLLTSYGLTNEKISNALNELTGKKPGETKIAFIPTGAHGNRGDKKWLIENLSAINNFGYVIDVIEITAHETEKIVEILNQSDVIILGGGNCFYLSYWLQKKDLFEPLRKLAESKIIMGISVGSMIIGNNFKLSSQALGYQGELTDDIYNNLGPVGESSGETLHLLDIVFKPHYNNPISFDVRNEQYIRSVSDRVDKTIYAVNDNTALKVTDGNIEIVGEGDCLVINK